MIHYNDSDYIYHHGVKGMKWGHRKDKYKSHGIRATIARKQNEKVDKSFKKWNENSKKKANAIELGKKRNLSKIASEKNKNDKAAKKQYKQDNKAYKKALRSNTTYRKGAIKGEVGKDLSRKYMSEAKKAKKLGDQDSYSRFMSKHDVERAKARRAPSVGAKRSQAKANVKRATTIAVKTAIGSAAVAGGVYFANKNGMNISISQVNKAANIIKKGKNILGFI